MVERRLCRLVDPIPLRNRTYDRNLIPSQMTPYDGSVTGVIRKHLYIRVTMTIHLCEPGEIHYVRTEFHLDAISVHTQLPGHNGQSRYQIIPKSQSKNSHGIHGNRAA